jgi:hypothetical protein
MHYERSVSEAISAFDSQLPGMQPAAGANFGAVDGAGAGAMQTNAGVVEGSPNSHRSRTASSVHHIERTVHQSVRTSPGGALMLCSAAWSIDCTYVSTQLLLLQQVSLYLLLYNWLEKIVSFVIVYVVSKLVFPGLCC